MTAEMKGFLSVLFNMGLIKRNKRNDYWKTKYKAKVHHGLHILHSFHIVDNDKLSPKADPA